MQEITEKDFDNKFKQAFDEMEVTPSKDLFAKIENEIHQKRNRRIPFFVAAASIAAILAIGFIWQMQSSTEVINPKIANSFSQNIEKVENISPTKIGQSGTNLIAKTNADNRIKKVEKKTTEKILLTSEAKHYNENITVIKKQEPKILDDENNATHQNIRGNKKLTEYIALVQVNAKKLPIVIEEVNRKPALNVMDIIPKDNNDEALAISESTINNASAQNRNEKFISGLFKNFKQKVTDITSEVISSNNDSTTVNLGFVAITKYKN